MLKNFTLKQRFLSLTLMFLMLFTIGVNASSMLQGKAGEVSPTPHSSKSTFSQDFEGETFPPEGWTVHSLLDNSQSWELSPWQNHTPDGTKSAFHNNTQGEESVDNWLVTPKVSVAANGFHYLSFWSYLGNGWSYKKNSVLVSTGSPDPADEEYVEVWAGISNDGWIWAHFFVDLQDYVGQDIYIAFRYEGDTWGHNWNIDDVAIADDSPIINLSTLEVSQTLAINGIGSKSVMIDNHGILDLDFDVDVVFVDSDSWLTVEPINGSISTHLQDTLSLNFDAAGLEPGTYKANLNIASNDPENPSVTVDVTLNVIDVNVYPFTENFEGETFPPIGWSIYNVDEDDSEWTLSWLNNTPDGSYSAYHGWGWSPQDGWLVTPQITVPNEGFYYLSFWSNVGDIDYYGKNSVHISTASGNPADEEFVEVWAAESVVEGWVQYFINIEEYAGEDIYIAFRYEGENAHTWNIDDIALGNEIDDSPVMVVSTDQVNQTLGQDGSGTKSFKVINDGIKNLTFDIEIDFTDGDGWLVASPTSGSIPAKSFKTITLTFDATGLDFGEYSAEVKITSNDSENPTTAVVATLTVMEAQPVNLTIIYPEYTFPTAISSDGMYVSGSQFGGKNSYQWTMFSGSIDFAGEAMDITDNGLAVGTYDTEFTFEGGEVGTAGIWDRTTNQWKFLGMNPEVPEFFGSFYNTAYGINADGSTVVGMQWYADWNVKAIKWTEEEGYVTLSPDFSDNTRANGISANGSVIYGWAEPNWTRTPAIWYNDEMILIDETQYGEAAGASASGNYVTGSVGSDGFIWSPSKGVTLFQNTLNSGIISPIKILDDGTIFGYTNENFPPLPDTRRAFVRHPDGTLETFNEYVANRGWFDASDWIFLSINDVTPDGNKFIGAAELPSGEWISFMLDLDPGTPSIEVNSVAVNEIMKQNEETTQNVEIKNVGTGFLSYNAIVQYTAADPKVRNVPQGIDYKSGKLSLGKKQVSGNYGSVESRNSKSTTLNYDGDNVDAIGLNAGGTFYGAARYPSQLVAPFEDYKLESVEVYIGNIPTEIKLMVWDAGTTTTAGALLYEQAFTPSEASWNTVTLDNAVEISGNDIWIGFEITHGAGLFVLGLDGGPAVQNGDRLSQNAQEWERLSDYGLNGNWNIRANLSFNGMNWLSISPYLGVLNEDHVENLTLEFNSEALEMGNYTANIRITSNDSENELVIIPVTLTVESANSVEDMQLISVNVYPNPASSNVNIVAQQNINSISIINMLGQTVFSANVNSYSTLLDVTGFRKGIYFVQVNSSHGVYTQRLLVN